MVVLPEVSWIKKSKKTIISTNKDKTETLPLLVGLVGYQVAD